jgi:hypothetical protein
VYLTRCQDQKPQTLEEFYGEESQSDEPSCREGGKAMLALLTRLGALSDERRVYGLTSLYRLCLLAEDTWMSPWFVIIVASNTRKYYVEYLVPERGTPSPRIYIRGEAHSEDEAVQMILTAMDKSEGWTGMSELG